MIATPADQSESGLKDRYRDFQYLAQEVLVLERYNRAVLAEPDKGELRIHSFLALTLMALERFLRMVLDERANRSTYGVGSQVEGLASKRHVDNRHK